MDFHNKNSISFVRDPLINNISNISSRICSNTEVSALDLLQNVKKCFLITICTLYSDVMNIMKYLIIYWWVILHERAHISNGPQIIYLKAPKSVLAYGSVVSQTILSQTILFTCHI